MKTTASAKDFMATSLVTFHPDMDIMEAIQLLVEKRISGAPVVDQIGNLVGMLSEKDCLKVALDAGYHGEWGGRVEEYMNPHVQTIDADTSILDVARYFIEGKYRRYPIMKDNRLVGQISRRDVLKGLQALM
jgi:CBS domain-containing protein